MNRVSRSIRNAAFVAGVAFSASASACMCFERLDVSIREAEFMAFARVESLRVVQNPLVPNPLHMEAEHRIATLTYERFYKSTGSPPPEVRLDTWWLASSCRWKTPRLEVGQTYVLVIYPGARLQPCTGSRAVDPDKIDAFEQRNQMRAFLGDKP
jgi:hypothetical protein